MDIMEQVNTYLDEAISIRRKIHRHPEVAMKEYNTTRLIKEELEKYGIEIEDKGYDVGVSAIIRGGHPGKTVALRADIDALPITEQSGLDYASKIPGVAHACGHDIHTALLLLCARILNNQKKSLKGNVKLIFQPAEELFLGAKYMIQKGVMQDPSPDVIVGFHVGGNVELGKIGLIKGVANASADIISITIKGIGGHGAHPYNCVDPILTASLLVNQLRTLVNNEIPPFEPAVLTFGAIHGGDAPNIIPPKVELRGTLRTFSTEVREKLHQSIKRIVEHLSRSMRATGELNIEIGPPPVVHSAEVVEAICLAAEKTIGKQNIIMQTTPNSGSEDFSYFLKHCPGARIRLGTGISGQKQTLLGNHNPKVIFDERSIAVGAKVVCQYTLDFLNRAELATLSKAKL